MAKPDWNRTQKDKKLEQIDKALNGSNSKENNKDKVYRLKFLNWSIFIIYSICIILSFYYAFFEESKVKTIFDTSIPLRNKAAHLISWLSFIVLINFSLNSIARIKKIREDKNININFIRIEYRNLCKYLLIFFACLLFGLILGFPSKGEIQPEYIFSLILFTLSVITLGLSLRLFSHPALLVNKNIIFIGDYLFNFIPISFNLYLTSFLFNKASSLIVFIIGFIVFLGTVQYLIKYMNKNQITPFQKLIIDFVDIELLSFALASFRDDINAERRALKEIENRIAKNDYVYLLKINEQIVKKISPKTKSIYNYVKYIVIGIITFVLCSIGEGLVQDIFNEEIKKQIMKIIEMFK